MTAASLTILAASTGGGLAVFGADLSISRTTVADNYTTGSGGGLSVAGNAEVTITQSAFTGNGNEYGSGGGIAWGRFTDSGPSPATGTITNTTISGNSGGSGGGIALIAGTLTLNNVTISDNDADYGGGGVAVYSSTTLTLNRTIISGNATDGDGDEVYVYGAGSPTLTANNFNLFGHSGLTNAQAFDGFTPGANDITATSNGSQPTALGSIVSPLADNGGPTTPATQTHALPLGSPARDKAPGAACVAAPVDAVDQRDVTRPQDGNGAVDANECDIGAFEAVLEPVSGICPAPGSELTTIIGKGMGNTKKVVFRTKLVVPNANDLVGLYGQLAGKNFVRPPRFARFYYPNKTYTQIDTMTSPAEHYGGIFWFGGELQPAASVTGRWFLTNGPKQKFPRALVLYATHETMAEYFNTYVLFDDGTQNMVGPGAPFEQEQTLTVPIDPPLAMTDITVQVALVDNDSDSRSIWVRADAGTESALSITTGPSHGNLLNVITLVIEDVPAGVSEVELHLFSGDGEVPGDSAAVIGAAVNYSCEVPH